MLTRQEAYGLIQNLEDRGFRLTPIAVGCNATSAATVLSSRRDDAVQQALEWVNRRGDSNEALAEFVRLLGFTDRDVFLARNRAKMRYHDIVAGVDNSNRPAIVAAYLVNEWLNKAVAAYGNSSVEYDCARLAMQSTEPQGLRAWLTRKLRWASMRLGLM